MKNSKDLKKALTELFESIKDDTTLVPKAREMNKTLSILVKANKAEIEYNKYRNTNKKIDLFE